MILDVKTRKLSCFSWSSANDPSSSGESKQRASPQPNHLHHNLMLACGEAWRQREGDGGRDSKGAATDRGES